MGLLRLLARAFLVNRLFRRRRPPPGYPGGAYGRVGPPRYRGRRGRVGLFGPVPYYSTTTGRGTRVSVGGCCLPIPLFVVAAVVSVGVLVGRRLTTAREWNEGAG